MFEFEVVKVARKGTLKDSHVCGEVELEMKDDRTIYTSSVYLKVPLDELPQYTIGQRFCLAPEKLVEAYLAEHVG